jgi:hypothetical protein
MAGGLVSLGVNASTASSVAAHLLDVFGVEQLQDLAELDEADIQKAVEALGLKKVQAKKLLAAWVSTNTYVK